jgi:hypothetical protein
MIKKLLLLLLLIVFVNPIFAQIEQLGAATTAVLQNADQLIVDNPGGLRTGDIMIVTIAQKQSNEKNPVSSGWTLVASDYIEK